MRGQHQRPRGRGLGVGVTSLVVAMLVALGFSRSLWSGATTQPNTFPTSVPTAVPNSTTTTATPTTTTTKPVNENPFLSPVMADYLKHRTNDVTAGLYDVATGATYLYRPGRRQVTASMFKIDILADLLYQDQVKGETLNAKDLSLATSMIEISNNAAAQRLWVRIGQVPAITIFNKQIGFTQSIASWTWGQMDTTPKDQLTMLKAIVFPNKVLDGASRTFERGLMEHVISSERFGVPTDVPTRALVGVKNGWYPEETTGWQVNTAGFVHLGSTYYLAVVMSAHNPNEDYGMDTVNTLGRLFWQFESSHA